MSRIDPTTLAALARRLADYRLGGCPSGGASSLMREVRRVATRAGISYSELWSEVHRAAYEIIDDEVDGR